MIRNSLNPEEWGQHDGRFNPELESMILVAFSMLIILEYVAKNALICAYQESTKSTPLILDSQNIRIAISQVARLFALAGAVLVYVDRIDARAAFLEQAD